MKTKILSFFLVVVLLSIYPAWRYISNAKTFAEAIFAHVSKMGSWTYGSISSNFDGKITIRNVAFTPKNYTQGLNIGSVMIKTNPMFLLKAKSTELAYLIPDSLSLSVNAASLNNKSNDVYQALKQQALWMLQIGYAGSFGCNKDQFTTFEDQIWQQILKPEQVYNVDLYFSRQADGSLDADLILDAENMFSSTWSSNLISSYQENQIVLNELLLDKLYYSYLDNGFNLVRNNACIENYKSSFAAYRLSSAEHIQQFLRINYSKELPVTLTNWYQRALAADTEYNVIISLNKKMFVSDVYNSTQLNLLENAVVEVSTSKNEYMPVALKEIDYTKIDTSLILSENIKKQKHTENAEKNQTTKTLEKPNIIKIGESQSRSVSVANLGNFVNQSIRIKTAQGRPIIGVLRSVNQGLATLDSTFSKGQVTLSISIDTIASVELL